MSQIQYALMCWLTDNNYVSVHHLKNVKRPQQAWSDFKVGDICYSTYPGKKGPDGDGCWKCKILSLNASKKVLEEELNSYVKQKQTALNVQDASKKPSVEKSSKKQGHSKVQEDVTLSSDGELSDIPEPRPQSQTNKRKRQNIKSVSNHQISTVDNSSDEEDEAKAKKLRVDTRMMSETNIMKMRAASTSGIVQKAVGGQNLEFQHETTGSTVVPTTTVPNTTVPTTAVPTSDVTLTPLSSRDYNSTYTPQPVSAFNNLSQPITPSNDVEKLWHQKLTQYSDGGQYHIQRPTPQYVGPSVSESLSGARASLFGGYETPYYRTNMYDMMARTPDNSNSTSSNAEPTPTPQCECRETVSKLSTQVEQLVHDVKTLKKALKSVREGTAQQAQPEEEVLPTGCLKSVITNRIEESPTVTAALKVVMPMVFTLPELLNCSIKGQNSGKSKEGIRRVAFDVDRRDFLSAAVIKHFKVEAKLVMEKMRNRLKIIREQYYGEAVPQMPPTVE